MNDRHYAAAKRQRPGSMQLARDTLLLRNPGTTPAQDQGAAIVLAGHARDAAELRTWLQMLGLLPYSIDDPRYRYAQKGEVA